MGAWKYPLFFALILSVGSLALEGQNAHGQESTPDTTVLLGATAAGPSAPAARAGFEDFGARHAMAHGDETQRTPPRRFGRMALEALAGAAVGAAVVIGGGSALHLMGVGPGPTPSWDLRLSYGLAALGLVTYGAGCAAGVSLVGNRGDETGSFWRSLAWSELGIVAGVPLGGWGGVYLAPVGATYGFNSKLRYKRSPSAAPPSGEGLTGTSVAVGQVAEADGSIQLTGAAGQGRQRAKEFAVGLSLFEVTAAHAWGTVPGWLFGLEAGVGGGWPSYTVTTSDHYDGMVVETAHVALYAKQKHGVWEHEEGARASLFLQAKGDWGSGGFVGGYGTLLVGWKHVKFGPRVLVGLFSEESQHGLGLSIIPVTARLIFPY